VERAQSDVICRTGVRRSVVRGLNFGGLQDLFENACWKYPWETIAAGVKCARATPSLRGGSSANEKARVRKRGPVRTKGSQQHQRVG
jgi:hypothetical protein